MHGDNFDWTDTVKKSCLLGFVKEEVLLRIIKKISWVNAGKNEALEP